MDECYLMYDRLKNVFYPLERIPPKRMSLNSVVNRYSIRPRGLKDESIIKVDLEKIIKNSGIRNGIKPNGRQE